MVDQAADESDVVVVTVVRTGGFAGLNRTWTAEPPAADTTRWITLIDACPWDDADAAADDGGADRFMWRLDARHGGEERRMRLPETRLNGPWRDLVDQVQSFEQERSGADDPGDPDGGAGV
jgi:hypothetical protein